MTRSELGDMFDKIIRQAQLTQYAIEKHSRYEEKDKLDMMVNAAINKILASQNN